MVSKQGKNVTRTIVYILSAIVILSLILGLLGPVLIRAPKSPTPTWTPVPTATETALGFVVTTFVHSLITNPS